MAKMIRGRILMFSERFADGMVSTRCLKVSSKLIQENIKKVNPLLNALIEGQVVLLHIVKS
jgi:hypothetical protein